MIVVDVNILVEVIFEDARTEEARELFEIEPEWAVPVLWRHEFLNVLVTRQRVDKLTAAIVQQAWSQAEALFSQCEHRVSESAALSTAIRHSITAYDAQYLTLAEALDAPLITEDQALRRASSSRALGLRGALAHLRRRPSA